MATGKEVVKFETRLRLPNDEVVAEVAEFCDAALQTVANGLERFRNKALEGYWGWNDTTSPVAHANHQELYARLGQKIVELMRGRTDQNLMADVVNLVVMIDRLARRGELISGPFPLFSVIKEGVACLEAAPCNTDPRGPVAVGPEAGGAEVNAYFLKEPKTNG